MPWAPRTEPEPTATGLTTTWSGPRCDDAGAGADDVGDRVEGADLVEVHVHRRRCRARWPRPRRGARRPGARGRGPARPAAPRGGARGRRARCGGGPSRRPRRGTGSRRSRRADTVSTRRATGSGLTASTASCRTSSGTPAPSSAPRSMSPLAPDDASTQSVRHAARCRLAGDPRREHPRAVAVVDVDHGDAGRAGVEHREQRGDPAEGGAVADAGRHRDERHADQAADHGRQRALHAGDDDQAVGAARAGPGPPAGGARRRRRRPRSGRPRRRARARSAPPRRRPARRRCRRRRPRPCRAPSAAARASRRGRPGAARPRAATSPPARAPPRRAGSRAPHGRGAWRAACGGSPRPARASCPRRTRPRRRRSGSPGRRRRARTRGPRSVRSSVISRRPRRRNGSAG